MEKFTYLSVGTGCLSDDEHDPEQQPLWIFLPAPARVCIGTLRSMNFDPEEMLYGKEQMTIGTAVARVMALLVVSRPTMKAHRVNSPGVCADT